jgi:predicted NBD/HSP70 family sugar kinase
MAVGLLDAIYLLDPARIVIMGPLAEAFERVGPRVVALLREQLAPGLRLPDLKVAATSRDAGLMGAAALVRGELFALPRLGGDEF